VPISYELLRKDAVIIGGGLAGLTAARSLELPDGMSLAILAPGAGASPFVHGFNMPLHQNDSVDCFINDTIKSGYAQGDARLVATLCAAGLDLLPFLETLGIRFDREADDNYTLLRPLGASWPRVVGVGNNTGVAIMKRIRVGLAARANVMFYNTLRAVRLMGDEGGVRGVLAYDFKKKSWVCLETKVVILATGGFCNIFPFSTNSKDVGGDGIAMAYETGVPLADLEFIQFEPSVAVYPAPVYGKGVITTMFYEGAVLRNLVGERFMLRYSSAGEQVDKDVLSRLIYHEINCGKGTAHGGVYFDATGVGGEQLQELYPMYVKRYADCGIDLARELIEIAPAPHTSLGGAVIAPDCSTSVAGLFACGEIVGGIHGANRMGGNAGLETLVFGRRAGETAGRYLSGAASFRQHREDWVQSLIKPEAEPADGTLNQERMAAIRFRMEQVLSGALNVIRSGDALQPAARELGGMIDEIDHSAVPAGGDELYLKIRLRNDLMTAYLLSRAALERTESVGCHVRADAAASSGRRYRIQIRKGTGGAVLEKVELTS
jgi:fumarate reductase (CoM/CoB) subunit A